MCGLQFVPPPPMTIPKLRRYASNPEKPTQETSMAAQMKTNTPVVSRRRPAIKMFSFYVVLNQGVLEVHGGIKDNMDELYRNCTGTKMKWKARVNVPSTNMKKPGSRLLTAAMHAMSHRGWSIDQIISASTAIVECRVCVRAVAAMESIDSRLGRFKNRILAMPVFLLLLFKSGVSERILNQGFGSPILDFG